MAQYDAIAAEYKDSKRLPFREFVERHTLFRILGDLRGKAVLDMACGEGFYTRRIKLAGASDVLGVDISGAMICLAEEEERTRPLGCRYVRSDAQAFRAGQAFDIVVAMYLLNYARTGRQLQRMCRACYGALRPGGRFVGVNDNVRHPPLGTDSLARYGFVRSGPVSPLDGDMTLYEFTNRDGRQFQFRNYYLSPRTYRDAFQSAGFRDFRWIDVSLHPSRRGDGFWSDFMARPPIVGFAARKLGRLCGGLSDSCR